MSAYRVIVVGGGGAGIPFAVRVAETDAVEVLLLEAGPAWRSPADAPDLHTAHLRSAATVAQAMPDRPLAWTYDTRLFRDRDHRIARGRLLGGSTAVNGAYFMRAHPDDFSDWATVAGPEWSYDSALPALRRLEHDRDFPEHRLHGSTGPVPVTRPSAGHAITRAFLDASAERGHSLVADKNGEGQPGAGRLPVNAVGGLRMGTAIAYLSDAEHDGLTIRGSAMVRRVLFDGTRAVGVEVIENGIRHREFADEVVLAAGAIETPRLLMRSGVGAGRGSRDGRKHVIGLPGVGAGLSDHPAVMIPWLPERAVVRPDAAESWTAALNFSAPGGSGRGDVEILLAVMPDAHIVSGRFQYGYLSLRVALHTPRSRGIVHPEGAPFAVDYQYLRSARDRSVLRYGIREALRLLTGSAFRGTATEVDAPVAELLADDAIADDWIDARLGTSLHSAGTARMGDSSDGMAVTDSHGRVHGVDGLRVVDTSLLPAVPSRGTAATAVFLGERLAELWRAEWSG